MEHPHRVEMDLLHHRRSRVRPKRSSNGVCPPLFWYAYHKLKTNRWAHEICADDNEERALVVGSMNEMAYVFQAWLPQVVWRQVEAPGYRKGFITVTVLSGILILATFVTIRLERRER